MDGSLRRLLTANTIEADRVAENLNQGWLPAMKERFNTFWGPRRFGRPPDERVPSDPRRLTEFRGRIGSLLEIGLGLTLAEAIETEYGNDLRLTFVIAHQYPDFFLRAESGEVLARFDFKLLHDESAEYSARFDTSVSEIDPSRDFLIYVAWQWRGSAIRGRDTVFPFVLDALAVPAIEIGIERDMHLKLRGGRIDDEGTPRVPPSDNVDTNFGKINRIVHASRRSNPDLAKGVRGFVRFVSAHADAVRQVESRHEERTVDEEQPPSGRT